MAEAGSPSGRGLVALASAAAARGTDLDEAPLIEALRTHGVDVVVWNWDDPTVRWADADLVLLRSTWDYMDHLPRFIAWLTSVDALATLRNPVAAVRWSMDKRYFRDLAAAGVPTIESRFVEPGLHDPAEPHIWQDALFGDWDEVVVKPCVGAGSRGVSAFDLGQPGSSSRAAAVSEAAAHAALLLRSGIAVQVQPRLRSVAQLGEQPTVFFGGEFSHAASKRVQIPSGGQTISTLFAPEDNHPAVASARDIDVATAAVRAIPSAVRNGQELLYARVDLVWADDGTPLVMEVELVEPSLFFPQAPTAAMRFADHITRVLSGATSGGAPVGP